MGTLLSVLLFASATASADTPAPANADDETVLPAPPSRAAGDDVDAGLRPISFESRAPSSTPGAEPPRADLRNPFAMTRRRAAPPPHEPTTAERDDFDLKNPFSGRRRLKRRSTPSPAPDLRNPFERTETPPPVLPACPDTGGVPIQRPSNVEPGCVQASRYRVLALR